MRLRSWGLVAVAAAAVLVVAALAVVIARVTDSGAPDVGAHRVSPTSSGQDKVAATLPATRVHRVSPVDAAGRLATGYRVTASGPGRCFSTSLVDERLYRCFRGNTILDPCWAQSGERTVTCLLRPWSRRAVRVRLTAPLPTSQSFGRHLWAVRVGEGPAGRCLVVMGAAGTVAGQRISYLCQHGWALLGDGPDRRRATWTMGTAHQAHGTFSAQGRRPLAAAWWARVP